MTLDDVLGRMIWQRIIPSNCLAEAIDTDAGALGLTGRVPAIVLLSKEVDKQ